MKLKPETRKELAKRRLLARVIRRGDEHALRSMAEIVRKNNAAIRADPFRAELVTLAAINFSRFESAVHAWQDAADHLRIIAPDDAPTNERLTWVR
jgi:hypothetical protein